MRVHRRTRDCLLPLLLALALAVGGCGETQEATSQPADTAIAATEQTTPDAEIGSIDQNKAMACRIRGIWPTVFPSIPRFGITMNLNG